MTIRIVVFLLIMLVPNIALSAEVIHNYHTQIEVRQDGGLNVTETIEVTAEGSKIRRGIYRDLPLHRRTSLGGILKSEYYIVSVKKNGVTEPWHVETDNQNGYKRLYIGKSNVMLPTGKRYVYEIKYSVPNQVFFFDGYDELNWNVIGNDWDFPIEHASANIYLPANLPVKDYRAYTGKALSRGDNYRAKEELGSFHIETKYPLNVREGITVAISWDEGYVQSSPDMIGLGFFWKQHPGLKTMILGLLILALYYYWAWWTYGVDPKSRGLAPFYTPPKGISPAMAASIYTLGSAGKEEYMTSAIISLASKGYFSIEDKGRKKYKISRTSKEYIKSEVSADERIIYNKIKTSLTITRSSESLISTAKKHEKKINSLCRKVYFVVNMKWWAVGLLIFVLTLVALSMHDDVSPVFFGGVLFVAVFGGVSSGVMYEGIKQLIFGSPAEKFGSLFMIFWAAGFSVGGFMGLWMLASLLSWLVILAIVLMVVGIVIMFPAMKAPTYKGQRVLEHIKGLKYYMESVEEKVLKKFDPPQMSRELYEEYLPYAVALGVESKWADKFALAVGSMAFEDARDASISPRWYSSSSRSSSSSNFSASSMVSSFGSTLSAASSSNSSSSSGGGSSGGGGGGGW